MPKLDTDNRIQENYDDKFNRITSSLRDQEQSAGADMSDYEDSYNNPTQSDTEGQNINRSRDMLSKKEGEGNPNTATPFANKTTPNDGSKFFSNSKQGRDVFRKLMYKKYGPLGGIAGLLIAGILGISGSTPSLLLVHMKEVLVSHVNFQETPLNERGHAILSNMLIAREANVGPCIKFACKYQIMPDVLIDKMEAAGFTALDKDGNKLKTGTDRVLGQRLDRFEVTLADGTKSQIKAAELSKTLRQNPELRSRFRGAYSPRYDGFADSIFQNVMNKYRISKRDQLADAKNEEDVQKKVEDVSSGREDTRIAEGNKAMNEDGSENADGTKENAAAAEDLNTDMKDVTGLPAEQRTSAVRKLIDGKSGSIASMIAGLYCGVTDFAKTMSIMGRGIQAKQAVQYAMLFLTAADAIKDGKATPQEVAGIASIITYVAVDNKNNTTKYSGTDSAIMKFGLHADRPSAAAKSTSRWRDFVPGAGMVGSLNKFNNAIGANIGAVKGTCKFVNSPAGGLLLDASGGPAAILTNILGQLGAAAIAPLVEPLLVKLAAMMVGNMTAGLLGEDAGDAFATGTMYLLSSVNMARGGGSMTKKTAGKVLAAQNDTLLAYAEEERASRSPLDIYSPYTAMGSIVHKFMPTLSSIASIQTTGLSGIFSTAKSITSLGTSGLTQATSASAEDTWNSRFMEMISSDNQECDDPTLLEGDDGKPTNAALTPVCTPVSGVDPGYLNVNPEAVLEHNHVKGNFDDSGNVTGGKLKEWEDNCTKEAQDKLTTFCNIDKESDGMSVEDKNYIALFFYDRSVLNIFQNTRNSTGEGISFMTYNVLGITASMVNDNGGDYSWQSRIRAVQDTIQSASPDVIGFQEVNAPQGSALMKRLGETYSFYPQKMEDGSRSRMIAWKTSLFSLASAGVYTYPRYDNPKAEMPWVKLTHIASGKTIYIINTHTAAGGTGWDKGVGGLTSPEARKVEAEKIIKTAQDLGADGSPVILTGDYNSTCEVTGNDKGMTLDEIPCVMLQKAGYNDAGETARATGANTINYEYATSHGEVGNQKKTGRHIDHIFYSANAGITVNSWENIINDTTKKASDHTPVVAKLTIPGLQQNTNTTGGNYAVGQLNGLVCLNIEGGKAACDDYAKDCSKYAYCSGQCVDFVLYRLVKSGMLPRKMAIGNGKDVVGTLKGQGFSVGSTPKVGAVFSTAHTSQPQWGHTGIVAKVNSDGSFLVEEYNFATPLHYGQRTIPADQVSRYSFAYPKVASGSM